MTDFPFLPDHNELIKTRYDKVQAMREAGINPYPSRYDAKNLAADLLEQADALMESKEEVSILGRTMVIRSFGKAAFFHVRDRSGQIQVYIKKNDVDEESFVHFKQFLDGGDLVGVKGTIFRTKTGEISIHATEFRLVSKAVRQLPEKWHGFKDVELRYRQRYVDLIANPEVAETFRVRSKIVSSMRRFLDDSGFMEVETPMMHSIYGGASAKPFETHHNALDMKLYMRIAPELFLKRLVVGGMDRVYEINRNFRNEGISTQHNPEFTMMELYAGGWNATVMMGFVEDIMRETAQLAMGTTMIKIGEEAVEIDLAEPFPRIKMDQAVSDILGKPVSWDMPFDEVKAATTAAKLGLPETMKTTDDAIVFLFEEHCEGKIVRPTFIVEFPKSISPLAKSIEGRPEVADRFELYVNGMELANGYSELNDPEEQYLRFKEQLERRKGGDMEAVSEIDEDYIRALEHGMVPTSGLGIGIDRLVMLYAQSPSIRDVILFPQLKNRAMGTATMDEENGKESVEENGET
jgi:lysyl-tRNA synthetase, class II